MTTTLTLLTEARRTAAGTQTTFPAIPLIDPLEQRRSIRAYANRPVEREKLHSILEAARWAPSGGNGQPWSFIVATQDDPATFETMISILMDGNKRWAERVPILILAVAQTISPRNGQDNKYALYDTGLAVQNMVVQATALGLHAHQMAGFYHDRAREAFDIPEGWDSVTVTAIGYAGDLDALPDDLRARETAPRTRKELAEFVFTTQWGQPMILAAATTE